MRSRLLGVDGPQVSVVGVGCNNFGGRIGLDATKLVVDAAIEEGITFFDTADVYGKAGGSERALGEALGARRADVLIASKFGLPMDGRPTDRVGSPEYIRWAVEGSLKRLGTDYLDLYQQHCPDPETPIADTLGALEELVQAGLVRYLGCSNFTGALLREADATAQAAGLSRFVSVQNHYSLLHREFEADPAPVVREVGVGVLPFFPLANGLLTGKYRKGEPVPEGSRLAGNADYAKHFMTDEAMDRVEGLRAIADGAGVTMLHLALGGLAAQPGVSSVIAGATRPEQVRANVAACLWEPPADVLSAIDSICPPQRP